MNSKKCKGLRNAEVPVHKKLKGFTLIEMVVVMAIISVLAGISSIAIQGYVRDARQEEYNQCASFVYTSAQNLLIQMEIKSDSVPFDTVYLMDDTKPKENPQYVLLNYSVDNGSISASGIEVNSSYTSTGTTFQSVTLLGGGTDDQKSAYKMLEKYLTDNVSADFTGTCQVFINFEDYVVDSAVYNGTVDNEIDYLQYYIRSDVTNATTYGKFFMGMTDIYTQKDSYKEHDGEFVGCYPMLGDTPYTYVPVDVTVS